ncbi:MAG TPA: YicC/YloC family endoribonuclease [Candidatus Methylacidiphilales bacterium]
MAGYGRGTATFDGRQIAVELSSVNRKQSDISLSMPRGMLELEPRVRDEINAHISRGRITVAVGLHAKAGARQGGINVPAARAYREELEELRKLLKLGGEVTLDQVLRGAGVLESENTEVESERAWPPLKKALKAALDQFVKMRKSEGEVLAADLRKRILAIQKNVKTIGVLAPKVLEYYRGSLLERTSKAGLSVDATDERLLKEIVLFADRSDITEELTRLRSHLDQFFTLVDKDEPVGRTLDFLLQEMSRETNTIGNKANFLAISQIVVGMKTELEKLREQVQNIE